MDIDEASRLIDTKINLPDAAWPDKPRMVVLTEQTIEKPWGWVFFYTSKLYLEADHPRDALAGNTPFIVNRETGEIIETGSARSINFYINEYEKSLG